MLNRIRFLNKIGLLDRVKDCLGEIMFQLMNSDEQYGNTGHKHRLT
jgi:hypothetical protein